MVYITHYVLRFTLFSSRLAISFSLPLPLSSLCLYGVFILFIFICPLCSGGRHSILQRRARGIRSLESNEFREHHFGWHRTESAGGCIWQGGFPGCLHGSVGRKGGREWVVCWPLAAGETATREKAGWGRGDGAMHVDYGASCVCLLKFHYTVLGCRLDAFTIIVGRWWCARTS